MPITRPHPKTVILTVLIFLTVAFIFANSLPDKTASAEQSTAVREIVEPILAPMVGGEENVTDRLIRKLAHFTEFALLGLELGLLFARLSLTPVFLCVMTALCDETLQIFTARGPQVQDVWLDIAGAMTGLACGLLLMLLWHRLYPHIIAKYNKKTEN